MCVCVYVCVCAHVYVQSSRVVSGCVDSMYIVVWLKHRVCVCVCVCVSVCVECVNKSDSTRRVYLSLSGDWSHCMASRDHLTHFWLNYVLPPPPPQSGV